jgi:HNH endonuclease
LIPFRLHTPQRRLINRKVLNYKAHRKDLKIDFLDRCGYCNSLEKWKKAYYEIDHFVPQKYLKSIKKTDYSNLVYSCRSCNNAKRKNWPSGDEKIHNIKNKGFVDPCSSEYNKHFCRSKDGSIIFRTKLGEWMYYSLKLYKPQHKIIWNLESLQESITQIKNIKKTSKNKHLIKKLQDIYDNFFIYIEEHNKL